jgi:arginine deiminase
VACTRGIIQARMAHQDREAEVEFAGLGLMASGFTPCGRISAGRFEGGDFMPLGDAALIGVGPRTDREGAAALLAQDPGFDEIAVVHQRGHPLVTGHDPMVAMHLDTYMNIASEGVVVGNPLLLSAASVTVYTRDGGDYRPHTENMPLDAYLRDRGWSIIPVTTLEQLCYASNFLCVRDGACVTPDTEALAPGALLRVREKAQAFPEKYGPLLRQAEHDLQVLRADAEFFPHKKEVYAHGLEMVPITLANATGGYGGAHCMTCVLRRG